MASCLPIPGDARAMEVMGFFRLFSITVASAALAFPAAATVAALLIQHPAPGPDKLLLIDRDGGGIKVRHSQGTVNPTNDELTELVLTSLPEGGKQESQP